MKLLSIEQARSIWLFPMSDINPAGKFLITAITELVKKYKFANLPNVSEAVQKKAGIQFGMGSYTHSAHGEIGADVGMFNDGIIGDTKTGTEATDDFLHDLLTWGQKECGLHYPDNIRKQYASKVHVEVKKSLNSLNSKLEKFAKSIAAKSPQLGKVEYQLGGINFVAEQVGPTVPQVFRFERAETVPFSTSRYYSYAAMKTKDHLELIEELEAILA